MSWTFSAIFSLGAGKASLTVNAALVAAGGSIAVKDIATTAGDLPGDYLFMSSAFPDGFRGHITVYTGTVGAATNLSGVTCLASSGMFNAIDEAGAKSGANGGLPTVDASNNVHGLQTRTVSDTSVIGTSTLGGTAQTGDSYAIVSNANYGNAALATGVQVANLGTTISSALNGINTNLVNLPLAVWNIATSALTTAGTIGNYLANLLGLTTQQAKLVVNNDGTVNTDATAPVVNVALNAPYSPQQTTTLPQDILATYGCSLLKSIGQVGGYIGTIPSDRTNLLLTVKSPNSLNAADSSSVLQISELGGLLYFNGSPATGNSAWASLVVTDAINGVILISLNELAMLLAAGTYSFDIKVIRPGNIGTILVTGHFYLSRTPTQTT